MNISAISYKKKKSSCPHNIKRSTPDVSGCEQQLCYNHWTRRAYRLKRLARHRLANAFSPCSQAPFSFTSLDCAADDAIHLLQAFRPYLELRGKEASAAKGSADEDDAVEISSSAARGLLTPYIVINVTINETTSAKDDYFEINCIQFVERPQNKTSAITVHQNVNSIVFIITGHTLV